MDNTIFTPIAPSKFIVLRGTIYSIGGSSGIGCWLSSGATILWNPVADADTKFLFESASDFEIGSTAKSIAELGSSGFVELASGARVIPSKYSASG
ncbi:hypothetical protein LCGC14_0526360 [marine sediment metagenome]|uniref:Uncharacterized protein n=1 Tax=marine sediment metagenome TaxID=412755 RepID=A0A0F9UIE4_9ZZZZ